MGWVDDDYIGIDQGPIVLMIENHRSELRLEGDARQSAYPPRPGAGRLHRRLARREASCACRFDYGFALSPAGPAAVRLSRLLVLLILVTSGCARTEDSREVVQVLGDGLRGRSGRAADTGIRTTASRHPGGTPATAMDCGARETADRFRRQCAAGHLPARQHLDSGIRRARRAGAAGRAHRRLEGDRRRRLFPGHLGYQRRRRPRLRRALVRRYALALLPPRPVARRRLRHAAAQTGTSGARAMAAIKAQGRAEQIRRSCCRSTSSNPCWRSRCSRPSRCCATAAASAISAAPASGARWRSTRKCSTCSGRRAVSNNQISNVWDEFGRGLLLRSTSPAPGTSPNSRSAFRRSGRTSWMTMPLPGPNGPGASIAGGSSLVLFRASRQKQAAWHPARIPVGRTDAEPLPGADRRPAAAANGLERAAAGQ